MKEEVFDQSKTETMLKQASERLQDFCSHGLVDFLDKNLIIKLLLWAIL